MSASPTGTGPRPAYVEALHEETQRTIHGSRQSANVAAKRTKPEVRKAKRDAASDSGYSSRTATTGGSLSQDSKPPPPTKHGLLSKVRSMAGATRKSKTKEAEASSQPPLKKTLSRSEKRENLRVETREEAGRMRPSGNVEPAKDEGSRKQAPPSPQATKTPKAVPRPILKPIGSRPVSFHGPLPPVVFANTPQMVYAPAGSLPTVPLQHVSYHPPPATFIAAAAPFQTSPNRQIAYNFSPTTPQYFPQPLSYGTGSFHAPAPLHPPPLPRRNSVHYAPVVEYPTISSHQVLPRQKPLEYIPPRRPDSLSRHDYPLIYRSPTPDDEGIDLDEVQYRTAADRRSMPPPPRPERPKISHSVTTSAMSKRANRNSVEYVPRLSHSPHKQSIE